MREKFFFVAILLFIMTFGVLAASPEASVQSGRSSGVLPPPMVVHAVKFDISPPLRDMKPIPPPKGVSVSQVKILPVRFLPKTIIRNAEEMKREWDPVVQTWPGIKAMPAPLKSWEGISNAANAPYAVTPPDTEGDVGQNDYVQWVNLSLAIWDKSGNLLYGPVAGNTIWQGFGGPADSCNDGDPIVLYDRLAKRWFISQFALCANNYNGPYYQYIAVSQTSDPTGSWYRYAFEWPGGRFPDYPKFGVWPDGYYMSCNQFTNSWAGAGVAVFDRAKMLVGDPTATFQYFDLAAVNINYGNMLPSTFSGSTAPPTGAPDYYVEMDDNAWGAPNDQLSIWAFHVDWATPANTTFGLFGSPETVLVTAPFNSDLCNYDACIPQPNSAPKLDSLSDRLMYRLQYRNFGNHQTLVVNHTVNVAGSGSNQAGIRWYELRNTGTVWSIFQQGTFAPDSDDRWMGSAAMDKNGDLAIGYSVSSSTTYPSIRYAGRLASDPLNELTQGESTMIAGSGSQKSSYNRWGDYSTLSVDPADDCTFWYTQEYYATTSNAGWQTRIGAFRFPACGGTSALTVAAQANPNSGSVPLTVSFTATAQNGTSPYSYAWDFGDGGTGTGSAVSHTYNQASTYTATVVVTDNASASASATVSVEVSGCTLSCTAGAPSTGQTGTAVSFNATATSVGCTGAPTYDWNFGDNSVHSSVQNASHSYTAAGIYTWTMTATVNGVSCTKTGAIQIVDPPVISNMAKKGRPFRIKVTGSNLQSGIAVYISGTFWGDTSNKKLVKWKNSGQILIKKGSRLKAVVPKNTPVTFRFVNPDGGETTLTWQRP